MEMSELLALRGLDLTKRIKLVRHLDQRLDLEEVRRRGFFDLYQAYQANPVFTGCDFIVSFRGTNDSRALLYGVFEVRGVRKSTTVPLPPDCPFPQIYVPRGHFYELRRLQGFEDLEDRLVIDWGKSALSWHQWLKKKSVTELLPAGRHHPFPGHLEFVLRHDELVRILKAPRANRDWHLSLGAVAGVYLITDATDGKQYVGSATGQEGILGRWREYAQTGHGGNALLKKLLDEKGAAHARHFQFTILATLPRGLSRMKALEQESLYKRKLGSRAFGLNS
jgi:hypothetical protein